MKVFFITFFLINLWFFGAFTKQHSDLQRRLHHAKTAMAVDHFFAPLLRQPQSPFQELEYKCGGTWIHRYFVLTTAYCLKFAFISLKLN